MSWEPLAMALARGVARAALPNAEQAALKRLDSYREEYLLNAVSTLQSYTGQAEPGRARPSELEGLVGKAWPDLREGDREELRESFERLLEEDAHASQSAASRLGRRVPVALYRSDAIRAHLEGRAKGKSGGGGSRGALSGQRRSGNPAPILGLLVLTGLGAGVGFVATRPHIDEEAPAIRVEAPGSVGTRAVKIQGEIDEEDLATLTFDGQPVSFESIGPERYRFTLEVEDLKLGENSIELQAADRGGRTSSRKIQLTRTPYPARVLFSEPKPNAATSGRQIRVVGKVVSDGHVEAIHFGAQALEVTSAGAFSGTIGVPAAEGAHKLAVSATGPDARGSGELRIVVDRSPPKIVIGRHESRVYGASFDLPILVRDHSDYVQLEITGLGPLKPLHAGREHHIEVPVPAVGEHSILVQAKDALGNAAESVVVKIVRKKASDDLLAAYRRGERAYRITKDLTVPLGQSLVIPPGSRVQVEAGCEIMVEGKLLAAGTPSGTIQISGRGWKGIRAVGGDARVELRYTEVRGSKNKLGGALYLSRGAAALLRHCTLTNNEATQNGGALYAVGRASAPCVIDLEDTEILENHAGSEGGGVNFNSHCRARLERVQLKHNVSASFGGGAVLLSVPSGTSEVEFKDCVFEGNSSRYGGGLQVGKNARARVVDCVFEGNTALTRVKNKGAQGGAILVQGKGSAEPGRVEVTGGRILKNRSQRGGGVAVHPGGAISLTRVDLVENVAAGSGGALYVIGSEKGRAAASLLQSHLVGNAARLGGGVGIGARVDFHADHVQFKSNLAHEWGGGLFAEGRPQGSSRVDLVACAFQLNRVQSIRGRGLRGRGEALRIAAGVEFDTGQLKSCKVPHQRASLAAGVHAPPLASKRPPAQAPTKSPNSTKSPRTPRIAESPNAPSAPLARRPSQEPRSAEPPQGPRLPLAPATGRECVEGDDDFARALGHYVAAALANDYHALRADRFQSGSSRMKSYEAKVAFPDVVSTRIWDTGRRHYACVTLSNTAPDEEATRVFEGYEQKLLGHLPTGWTTKEHTTRRGGRVREFMRDHVRIRLTLTRYELRSGARATVMLFFN